MIAVMGEMRKPDGFHEIAVGQHKITLQEMAFAAREKTVRIIRYKCNGFVQYSDGLRNFICAH